MLTVAQLIAKLQTMPQDIPVVIDMYSECVDLDLDRVTVIENMYVKRPLPSPGCPYPTQYYVTYREQQWDKRDGEPKLVTVCHFPGN